MKLGYEEVEAKTRPLLDKHGLQDWRVSVENLKKPEQGCNLLGYCDFNAKTLRIGWNNPRQFRQTLLHEIAHVLRGIPGHDKEWIEIASKLGCTDAHLIPYANS
jgi:hypothetical protein